MARRRKRPKALEDAIRSGEQVVISEKPPPTGIRGIIESMLKPISSTRTPVTLGGKPTEGRPQLRETEGERQFRLQRERQRRKKK